MCTKFYGKVLWERKDQVRVLLRSVEGCGSNNQKIRKLAIVYKTSSIGKSGTSGPQNSRCGKCCQVLATKTLSRGIVLYQNTFHLVYSVVYFTVSNKADRLRTNACYARFTLSVLTITVRVDRPSTSTQVVCTDP